MSLLVPNNSLVLLMLVSVIMALAAAIVRMEYVSMRMPLILVTI